jgi:hypothetical protein
LSEWLDPKLVVTAMSVVTASIIAPLLLHWLKGRRERADKILDIRTKAYTEYFRKFEEAAAGVGNDYEQFSQVTLRNEFKKLLESDNSNEAIMDYQAAVGDFPNKIMSAHRKATSEITTLKILGSESLLVLIEEFEAINQKILEVSSEWLQEMQQLFTSPDFDSPKAKEMTALGAKAKELQVRIIKQMRLEIGLNG